MPTILSPLSIADGDQLEPVARIAERLTGSRPHPTTVTRWCAGRGAAQIVLSSLLAGGQRVTTEAAYRAWLQALTDALANS